MALREDIGALVAAAGERPGAGRRHRRRSSARWSRSSDSCRPGSTRSTGCCASRSPASGWCARSCASRTRRARFGVANDELTDTALRVGRLQALMLPDRDARAQRLERRGALVRRAPRRQRPDADRRADRVPELPDADPDVGDDGDVHADHDPARRGLRRAHHRGARRPTPPSAPPRPAPARRCAGRGTWSCATCEFQYPGAEPRRCCTTSRFARRAGQTTAIIGSTGAGKTTLLSLIPRSGRRQRRARSLVDGVDVRELDPDAALGAHRPGAAAAVPVHRHGREQPALRQPGRHRRGALGGAGDRPGPRLRRGDAGAARGARSRRAAPTSPAGSGSVWPIARALVRKPEIYLFDDSFSALDLGTDARLRAALRPVTRRRRGDHRRAAGLHHPRRRPDHRPRRRARSSAGHATTSCWRAARRTPRSSPSQLTDGGDAHEQRRTRPAVSRREPATDGPAAPRRPGRRRARPRRRRSACRRRSRCTSGRRPGGCSRRLRPDRLRLAVVVALAVVSVLFSVLGPKILGHATDVIFAGVIGKQLPAGATLEQAVERCPGRRERQLRRHARRDGGDARRRHRLRPARPGAAAGARALRGGERARLGPGLPAQRRGAAHHPATARRVEEKLNRLPLPYFDKQPRGELLSRVTNDIDNISQTLQQTLSQLLTSLLTVVGVLVMMFVRLAAAGADRAGRGAAVGAGHQADRQALAEAVRRPVEAHRRAQRPDRGGVHRARAW